jgi:hypoxanthine phosphoribosyltransferase
MSEKQEQPRGPRVLFSEAAIARRVEELAAQISGDYAAVNDLLMIGVLRGAFIFLADLSRQLTVSRTIDFISVAAYPHGSTPAGAVRLILDLRSDLRGRHALIVEDIVDSGRTLAYLQHMLAARAPASLKTCALLRKRRDRAVHPYVDYLGFETADEWLVGYGLDYADRFRTLPYIGVIVPPA